MRCASSLALGISAIIKFLAPLLVTSELSAAAAARPRTFGKGIIQTIEPIREGRAGGVAVTVARYRTPNGDYINKVGVKADRPTECPSSLEAVKCIEKALS